MDKRIVKLTLNKPKMNKNPDDRFYNAEWETQKAICYVETDKDMLEIEAIYKDTIDNAPNPITWFANNEGILEVIAEKIGTVIQLEPYDWILPIQH